MATGTDDHTLQVRQARKVPGATGPAGPQGPQGKRERPAAGPQGPTGIRSDARLVLRGRRDVSSRAPRHDETRFAGPAGFVKIGTTQFQYKDPLGKPGRQFGRLPKNVAKLRPGRSRLSGCGSTDSLGPPRADRPSLWKSLGTSSARFRRRA